MSELTEILKETVNRLFGNLVTRDVLEKAEAGEWPTNLWTALVENGLTHPLVPENKGGVGATFEDIYEIIYAAGYHGAPVPLAETILASWLTAASGLDVPGGPDSPGAPMAILEYRDDAPLKLASTGAGWCLNGTAPNTPWGHMADTLVAVADAGGALRVALLENDPGFSSRDLNMAREPRDSLTFKDAEVAAISEPLGYEFTRDTVRLYGALFRSAQMAGATQRVLDISVEYALEREAFGRTISKFQAIQHQLASLAAHTAQATMATETAFRAADRGDPRVEIAVAKIIAGQTATQSAEIGHQVHGAIGFAHEHMLNFYTRRLWCWRAEYGSESQWAEELGRRAAGRGPDMLWSDLTHQQR
jgi:acyl-CoA dehydrogenase